MIRPTFRQALIASTLAVLRVIWIALMAGALMDVAIGVWLTLRVGRVVPSDVMATLTPALYAIAIGVALLSLWWRRLLGPERCVMDAPPASVPAGPGVAPETDAERRAVGALARFRTHSIVVWALCEAIAIFGLVLSMTTGDARHVTSLGAASLVLFGYHVPSRRRVEAIVDAVPNR